MEALRKLREGHLAKKDYCLKQISEIGAEAVLSLHQLSERGDKQAAAVFVGLIVQAIRRLMDVQHARPQQFRELAEITNCWPGFLTVDHDWQNTNEIVVRDLHLGERAKVNYKGKTWSRRTVEVRIALELLAASDWAIRMNALRDPNDWEWPVYDVKAVKKLKPLTRSNFKEWWNALEPQFIHQYGGDFENHVSFAHYWRNEGYKGEPRARALIRRDIKKKLKQAFHSIAPRVSAM